jgi:hypothetical protein
LLEFLGRTTEVEVEAEHILRKEGCRVRLGGFDSAVPVV